MKKAESQGEKRKENTKKKKKDTIANLPRNIIYDLAASGVVPVKVFLFQLAGLFLRFS